MIKFNMIKLCFIMIAALYSSHICAMYFFLQDAKVAKKRKVAKKNKKQSSEQKKGKKRKRTEKSGNVRDAVSSMPSNKQQTIGNVLESACNPAKKNEKEIADMNEQFWIFIPEDCTTKDIEDNDSGEKIEQREVLDNYVTIIADDTLSMPSNKQQTIGNVLESACNAAKKNKKEIADMNEQCWIFIPEDYTAKDIEDNDSGETIEQREVHDNYVAIIADDAVSMPPHKKQKISNMVLKVPRSSITPLLPQKKQIKLIIPTVAPIPKVHIQYIDTISKDLLPIKKRVFQASKQKVHIPYIDTISKDLLPIKKRVFQASKQVVSQPETQGEGTLSMQEPLALQEKNAQEMQKQSQKNITQTLKDMTVMYHENQDKFFCNNDSKRIIGTLLPKQVSNNTMNYPYLVPMLQKRLEREWAQKQEVQRLIDNEVYQQKIKSLEDQLKTIKEIQNRIDDELHQKKLAILKEKLATILVPKKVQEQIDDEYHQKNIVLLQDKLTKIEKAKERMADEFYQRRLAILKEKLTKSLVSKENTNNT